MSSGEKSLIDLLLAVENGISVAVFKVFQLYVSGYRSDLTGYE